MTTYARIVNGVVAEIIPPATWSAPPEENRTLYSDEQWEELAAKDGAEVSLSDRFPPDMVAQCVVVDESVRPGWVLVGDQFAPPAPVEPPPPSAVEMRQFRRALLASGRYADVVSKVAGKAGEAGDNLRIDWEFSTVVQRESDLVRALGPWADGEVDRLFKAAALIA